MPDTSNKPDDRTYRERIIDMAADAGDAAVRNLPDDASDDDISDAFGQGMARFMNAHWPDRTGPNDDPAA